MIKRSLRICFENEILKGKKIVKQSLKKFSVFVMMGVMPFPLAACGPTKDSSEMQDTKVESQRTGRRKQIRKI